MDTPQQPLTPRLEDLLGQHARPLAVSGERGEYVIMRRDVYTTMLGLGEHEEAEMRAAVRRGLVDVDAGRTQDLDEAFDELAGAK